MYLEPTIRDLEPKKLLGLFAQMSLKEDSTSELFKLFMPRVKEIKNKLDRSVFEVLVYHPDRSFKSVSLETSFTKWAAVEVKDDKEECEGLSSYMLKGGIYAKFDHKGEFEKFMETMQYIHNVWLPNSPFEIDNREHFQVLGEKYLGPNNPQSEEEIWIPVKEKS